MAVDSSQRQGFLGAAFTGDSFITVLTVPNGAANGINLISAIKSATGKFPLAVDLIVNPTVANTSQDVELRTAVGTEGFPLPHVPTAGGAHSVPFRLNLSQRASVFLCENGGGAALGNVVVIGYH